ncbi:uncharacterized protein KY384_004423 [Bacidia gigantensis]|uniref:uncharacterized protein n=1 Tax=Bacidia gigantensis TaxID=2732470 RepID=UPI001D051C40|nr:uncharacterized protein KY384_004423 [Bacidia gigantensis]KAG8531066.1 hypothetical protein KY384_004423 [Bacidia gigantensis]
MQEIESKGVGASGGELDLAGVDVGTVVKLKGSIGTWWGNRQIKLERIWILHTTSQEVSAWSETVAFHTDILRKPWMISEEEQIRARGGSDGAQRRRKARTSRKSQSNARPQLRTSTKNEGIRFRSEKQWEHEKDVCSGPKVVISEKTGLREAQKRAREEELEKRRLESRQGENPQPQVIMNKVVSKPVLRKSSNQVKAKNEKDLGPELQRFYQDEATFKKEQLRQQRDEDRAERQRLFSKRLRTANGSC